METRVRMILIAGTAMLLLSIAMVVAPFSVPYASRICMAGAPGVIDGGWELSSPADILYPLGDLLCHQQYSRSFILNGSQMPVCMRDTGIAFGLAAGFLVCLLPRVRFETRALFAIGVVLVLLMGMEWVWESFGNDSPFFRTVSGVSAGTGAAFILVFLLYRDDPDEYRCSLWKIRDGARADRGPPSRQGHRFIE